MNRIFVRTLAAATIILAMISLPVAALPATEPGRVVRTVHFEIDMRAEIAAGRFDAVRDQVGLRGAGAPLSWQQTTLAAPNGDGRFVVTISFDRPHDGGQPLQYKFKIDRPGIGPNEGWEDGRNHILLLRVASQTVARAFNSPPEPVPVERTGRIDRIAPIPSQFVETREVQVWLPPDYADKRNRKRRYPVLYLHDGQAMFDAAATGAEWQLDETAHRLVLEGAITPCIIVAVSSTGARIDDYTPSSMVMSAARTGLPEDRRMGGGVDKYARYLTQELKPLIDRRYRTRPEANHTATGGSSLAGLTTMWLLLHHSNVFGAGLVVSPAVWWDDTFILRDVASAQPGASKHPRVWLSIGEQEGFKSLPEARQLRDALMHKGWNARTLSYHELPDGTHDEASWAPRVEEMLRFLYGRADKNESKPDKRAQRMAMRNNATMRYGARRSVRQAPSSSR